MRRKKKHNKELILITTLYIASVLTFAAGSLGTYAWYSYSARAGAMYNGAAIGDGGSLQVGIFSDVEIPKLESFSSITVDTSGHIANYVYWSSGGFSQEQIEVYATTLDYASNEIGPVTSGQFINGANRDISLKTSPIYLESKDNDLAKTDRYLYLPLAFRYGSFSDFKIELSGLKFKAEADITQSVRIGFVDEYYGEAFILNPSAEHDGKTKVCGNLDLNGDLFYDYNMINNSEIVYGFYSSIERGERYEDNIYPEGEYSTFNAIHGRGIYENDYVPCYADYICLDNVLNEKCLANSSGDGIVKMGMYIYLEGWDYTCIDSGIGKKYKLDFEFIASEREQL